MTTSDFCQCENPQAYRPLSAKRAVCLTCKKPVAEGDDPTHGREPCRVCRRPNFCGMPFRPIDGRPDMCGNPSGTDPGSSCTHGRECHDEPRCEVCGCMRAPADPSEIDDVCLCEPITDMDQEQLAGVERRLKRRLSDLMAEARQEAADAEKALRALSEGLQASTLKLSRAVERLEALSRSRK